MRRVSEKTVVDSNAYQYFDACQWYNIEEFLVSWLIGAVIYELIVLSLITMLPTDLMPCKLPWRWAHVRDTWKRTVEIGNLFDMQEMIKIWTVCRE